MYAGVTDERGAGWVHPVLEPGARSVRGVDLTMFCWCTVHLINSTSGYLAEGERQEVLDAVRDQKLPARVRGVLDDDLLEKRDDRATFERAALVLFHDHTAMDAPGVDRECIETIERVWATVDARIRTAPTHDQHRQLLEYDFKQLPNVTEYTALLNDTPELANLNEPRVHESYNTSMFVYADIDPMYSAGFDRTDLGPVRDAVWHGQQVARIGNWLTTWERELREADYSSGAVVRGVENGAVRPDTLRSAGGDPDGASPSDVAARIRETGSEQYLLDRWLRERGRLREFDERVDSVGIDRYASGLETVVKYRLAARGLKWAPASAVRGELDPVDLEPGTALPAVGHRHVPPVDVGGGTDDA